MTKKPPRPSDPPAAGSASGTRPSGTRPSGGRPSGGRLSGGRLSGGRLSGLPEEERQRGGILKRKKAGGGKPPKGAKPPAKPPPEGGANALQNYLRAEQVRKRLTRWLLPALSASLGLNTVLAALAILLAVKGPEDRFWILPPYQADAEPLVALRGDPLTYERVSMWTNEVINRLFDFSHAGVGNHFRKMNIFFTPAGFAGFRQDLNANNWLLELRERNAVLYGDVTESLQVVRVGPEFWELRGKAAIRLDAPGYKPTSDEKSVAVRVVRGDRATPVIDPEDPFPPTNFLGLRIEYVELR